MTEKSGDATSEAVTAKQLLERLSSYDLERVTFCMPDGLPIVAAYIDKDLKGGAVITLSDEESPNGINIWQADKEDLT